MPLRCKNSTSKSQKEQYLPGLEPYTLTIPVDVIAPSQRHDIGLEQILLHYHKQGYCGFIS